MTNEGHSPPTPPNWLHAAEQPRPIIVPLVPAVPPPTAPVVPVKASLANREPVALGAAAQGLLTATLAVLVGFGLWTPTDAQIGLLLALFTALVGFITAWVRGRAWSPASVAKLTQEASNGN